MIKQPPAGVGACVRPGEGRPRCMSLIVYLFALLFSGLIVGALARLLLPGATPITVLRSVPVGVAGSFAAALLSLAVFYGRRGGGLLLSVLFASLFVWLIRRSRQRSLGGRHDGGYRRRGAFGL